MRSSKFTIFLILCTYMMSLKLLILAVQSSMQDVCHLIWRLQWPNLPQSLWLSSRALNTKIWVLIPHGDGPRIFLFRHTPDMTKYFLKVYLSSCKSPPHFFSLNTSIILVKMACHHLLVMVFFQKKQFFNIRTFSKRKGMIDLIHRFKTQNMKKNYCWWCWKYLFICSQ